IDVVLLEQDICGGGPSGRNGGFVNSWWGGLAELCERFGDGPALALCRAGSQSIEAIGRFCRDHDVDAWFTHAGDVGVAASPAQVGAWDEDVRAAERLGAGDVFERLSAEQTRARCDSPTFLAGVLNREAATVQPARLALGLRRVLLERGVRIFEGTPVTRFGAGRSPVAETSSGTVRAGSAVIALNAWASAWRRFRRVLTVRGSYIVLTAPAPEKLEEIGWTGGEGVWDQRGALHYARTTPDGRIALGIGGMQPGLARTIGPGFAYDATSIGVAAEGLRRMLPAFRNVPLEAAWGGPIDVAGHHVPLFGSLGGGAVHYGLGFTGNGVGPCHLGGRILAALTLRADEPELLGLPVVTERPMRFPPEPLRSPGVLIANLAIHRKDEAEDRGDRPGPLTDFVARLPRRLGYNLGP
ncbi:MAG: FAD-dependent oxidoreductase, partial [Actinobacteria bacterium]|nr:FAD-dependent oxidoreductase [Actinomycetota bacterium]